MKKFLIILMLCISFFSPLNIDAKITTIDDSENFATSSDYTFIPKFINGVTKLETSNSYNTTDHFIPNYRKAYRANDYHNYWAMYRNVGMWKQHIVDMKITIDDVIDTDPSNKCTKFGDIADEDVVALLFMTNNVGVDLRFECREQGVVTIFKVEFFDNKTGEELSNIKSVLTYTDIDADERILIDNDKTKEAIYYTPYAVEHLELLDDNYNNKYTFFKGNRKWTCNGDNSCLNPGYTPADCYNNNCEGCYKAGMLITLNDGSFTLGWAGMGIIFSSPGYLRIADPNSNKTVDKEIVRPGDELNYRIEQYVPNQSSSQHYKYWKITDKLENILETSVDNITVTGINDEDITDKFNITVENNTVTVLAKDDYLVSEEFYDSTFFINIKTKVGKDIKDVKEIINNAVLDVQYGNNIFSEDIPSNPVKTVIEMDEPQEVVEVPNTSKFTSMMMIISGIVLVGSGIFLILRMTKKKTST